MKPIIFSSNIDRQYRQMQQALQELRSGDETINLGRVVDLHENLRWNIEWQRQLDNCGCFICSWMGHGKEWDFLKKTIDYLKYRGKKYIVLPANPLAEGGEKQGFEEEEQTRLRRYLTYGGKENYCNLWLWLRNVAEGNGELWKEPVPQPWQGIFRPGQEGTIQDIAIYKEQFLHGAKLVAGVLFPRDEWVWRDLRHQESLIRELEAQGLQVIPVFSHWAKNEALGAPGVDEAVRRFFFDATGRCLVDVVINCFKFSLTVGRPVDPLFLQKLNVPILQGVTLLQTEESWETSVTGLNPVELSCCVVLPEFDGVIHGAPLAAKNPAEDGASHFEPIAERCKAMAARAAKWARLRQKKNSEKKIAIIFHNYPPRNFNIGTAEGLDSPASVQRLLERMEAAGYLVGELPANGAELLEAMLAQATNDGRFLTDKQKKTALGWVESKRVQEWAKQWPPKVRTHMKESWGEAPGEAFCYEEGLLVPGLRLGNVVVTVQPPRGFEGDPGKLYHSPDCAPTYHYLAFYRWLKEDFQADAVVHIGTHGSLEWLPGKGAGLSEACYPDLALADLPNVYPYLITVIGEGVQAKRRSAACLIGHLPPPMARAEAYEELEELEKMLEEYQHFLTFQPEQAEVAAGRIREKAATASLEKEVPPEADFSAYALKLHAYISDIKNMSIRTGLHILGQAPQQETLLGYLLALTRVEQAEQPSLPKLLVNIRGYEYEALLAASGVLTPDGLQTQGRILDEVEEAARRFIGILQAGNFNEAARRSAVASIGDCDALLREQLAGLAEHICEVLVPALQATSQEMGHLLDALSGCYVEPGPAGSPTSGMTDVLPTGRNFYGVDPKLLPSPAAWELGCQLGDGVIARYIAEEGRYPENIGMIFWSGANMRSRGQCIAEFLYFLGVRPVWQKGSQRVIALEVIPLAELKRPRLDVTARISGMFRDAMPVVVQWMDEAVAMVAALEEDAEDNYVRKHVQQDAAQLAVNGAAPSDAWRQASFRIFGCPPGAYGAGVGSVIEERNWESVDDLAKAYVRWGAHAYGAKAQGDFVPALFVQRLQTLDVTVKNEDNREVNMFNSDDFNSYHGGMIAAVRSLKGEAPRSYCGDTSDRGQVKVRSLQEEVKRLFRGEMANPKFIEGMKHHGYKGAADLAGLVSRCLGWDATSAVMEDWMYQTLAEKYALDATMQEWMKEVNPWALERITEKLLEASQRQLWQTDEAMLQQLRRLQLDIEGDLEERSDA